MKKFNILNVSSKFAICGLPIRADTYKTCSFGCKYCFSNNRKIMEFDKGMSIGNIGQLEKYLHKVLVNKDIRDGNFLDSLVDDGITWHCGGMSDPFQPVEQRYGITKRLIEITKEYGINVLFSTKANTLYDCDPDPKLHTFQLSVSNVYDNRNIEPRVPSIESRKEFYDYLKSNGFKVGIRVQPFIPFISDAKIVEMFSDADHFTIEGLKLVPQNAEHVEEVLQATGLSKDIFTSKGLLNIEPELRAEVYEDIIESLMRHNIPYSIADNDMHHIGSSKCCCGDSLVQKSTMFNNTAMCNVYGEEYTLDSVMSCVGGYSDCKCDYLFTSNRRDGCVTVGDFFEKRFDRKTSPFSPKFLRTDIGMEHMN